MDQRGQNKKQDIQQIVSIYVGNSAVDLCRALHQIYYQEHSLFKQDIIKYLLHNQSHLERNPCYDQYGRLVDNCGQQLRKMFRITQTKQKQTKILQNEYKYTSNVQTNMKQYQFQQLNTKVVSRAIAIYEDKCRYTKFNKENHQLFTQPKSSFKQCQIQTDKIKLLCQQNILKIDSRHCNYSFNDKSLQSLQQKQIKSQILQVIQNEVSKCSNLDGFMIFCQSNDYLSSRITAMLTVQLKKSYQEKPIINFVFNDYQVKVQDQQVQKQELEKQELQKQGIKIQKQKIQSDSKQQAQFQNIQIKESNTNSNTQQFSTILNRLILYFHLHEHSSLVFPFSTSKIKTILQQQLQIQPSKQNIILIISLVISSITQHFRYQNRIQCFNSINDMAYALIGKLTSTQYFNIQKLNKYISTSFSPFYNKNHSQKLSYGNPLSSDFSQMLPKNKFCTKWMLTDNNGPQTLFQNMFLMFRGVMSYRLIGQILVKIRNFLHRLQLMPNSNRWGLSYYKPISKLNAFKQLNLNQSHILEFSLMINSLEAFTHNYLYFQIIQPMEKYLEQVERQHICLQNQLKQNNICIEQISFMIKQLWKLMDLVEVMEIQNKKMQDQQGEQEG